MCQSAEQAVYEVLSRWKTRDFTNQRSGFGAVMLPSANFVSYQTSDISLKLPVNWLALVKDAQQILAAPQGAFNQSQNQFSYSHGINVISLPNPNGISLNQMIDNYLSIIIKNNQYLKPDGSAEIILRG